MKIESVIIIGAGTMGQGIAQWFVQNNIEVELIDQNHEMALKALERIYQSFDKLVASKKLTPLNVSLYKKSISVKTIKDLNQNADLIIEAIIENLEIKQALFLELDKRLGPQTFFASNTSSFSITKLSSSLSESRKKLFIGLHFFNPATIMKLVEVIPGIETAKDLPLFFVKWFNERNKIGCLCTDSPGFIVNRVARNFYGEALRSAETFNPDKFLEIDNILKGVGGFKMGPFELMDLIGIDINLSVTESVYHSFYEEARFKPHRLQREMVDAGRLGKKIGKGFYHYESK